MPRNASGTYSLPSGNPVSSGTLIDSNWANNTLNDLANEVTDSLSRSAEGGMLAPLRLTDGVQATPSIAFTNEPSTGLYRAGTNEAWFVTGGNQVAKFTSTGMEGRFAAGAAATPSLAAYNDVNTGLWFPAADTLAASTGGSERLRVDSGGNLGIGTESPAAKLHVVGNQYRQTDATASFGFVVNTTTATTRLETLFGGSSFAVRTNGDATDKLLLDSSGNLGIGTASPGSKLHVLGSAQVSVTSGYNELGLNGTYASASARVGAFRKNYDSPFDFNVYASVGSSGNAGALIFWRDSANENARFDTSGNLGVGTASPLFKLHVAQTSSAVVFGQDGTTPTVIGTNAAGTGSGALSLRGFPLTFTGNGAGGAEQMRLDSSGNLGIGTASPAHRLDLQGASGVGMQIFETSTGNNNRLIITQNGIVSKFNNTFSSGFGAFAWEIGGVERMRLDDSGNLGIGTASPAYRLDVVGASTIAARFKGNGTLSAVVLSDNNTVTEGYVGSVGDDIRIVAGTQEVVRARSSGNVTAGLASRATTATDGFLYVPTCAGTPTGTPTAITGFAPIVVNTTNNKLYFYSGGAWRDAGP